MEKLLTFSKLLCRQAMLLDRWTTEHAKEIACDEGYAVVGNVHHGEISFVLSV